MPADEWAQTAQTNMDGSGSPVEEVGLRPGRAYRYGEVEKPLEETSGKLGKLLQGGWGAFGRGAKIRA